MEKKETTVTIAELTQQEKTVAGDAASEIVGQLNQISNSQRQPEGEIGGTQTQEITPSAARDVTSTPTIQISKKERAAKRQQMLICACKGLS